MRVSVELPDPKTSSLDAAIAKQFADIQRQLMSFMASKEDSTKAMQTMMLGCLEEQQSTLVSALERLMSLVGKAQTHHGSSDALAGVMKGLQQTISDLPSDLKDALDRQYRAVQTQPIKAESNPRITVQMPKGLMTRIDSLEGALLNGLRRSRSRTFGSNY